MRKTGWFFIIAATLFSAGVSQAAQRNVITPEGAKPSKLFSPAIEANGLIFTSGQLALDPASGKIEGDIEAQTRQAMKNLQTVLASGGSSLDHLVKINIYLKNIDDYAKMNQVYVTFFNGAPPARTALQVGNIPMDGLIEIEGIAVKR